MTMFEKFSLEKCMKLMPEVMSIFDKYDVSPRELQHIATDLENIALKRILTGKGFGEER